jgi:hypothetical protein
MLEMYSMVQYVSACNNFQSMHCTENATGSSGNKILHQQCCVEEQYKEKQKSF